MKQEPLDAPNDAVYAAESRLKHRAPRFGNDEDIAAYELLQRVTRVLCTRCGERPGRCEYCNGAGYFFKAGSRRIVKP